MTAKPHRAVTLAGVWLLAACQSSPPTHYYALTAIAPIAPHAFAIVPLPHALSTAAVYAEADRLGLGRQPEELAGLRGAWREHVGVNDLQPASLSLYPAIAGALEALDGAGADHVLVCGSGPTCAGLWWRSDGVRRAQEAVSTLIPRFPDAVAILPVAGIGHNSPPDR